MKAITCDNVSFTFGEKPVLKNVSFELERGSYLSIIGANGSAKSTLLKCILALHETGKTTGTITVEGLNVAKCKRKELARVAAYVPQAGGFIPPFTVREFVALSRYPYSNTHSVLTKDDKEAVERAFSLTNTECFADKRLSELSGGERQRVYLASALAQGVNILLLDEPTSFLDPHNSAEVNTLLKRFNREEGYTIVTVTHDLNHPLDVGGYVLALRCGEEIHFGSSQGLLHSDILWKVFNHHFTVLNHPITGDSIIVANRNV